VLQTGGVEEVVKGVERRDELRPPVRLPIELYQ